MQDPVASLIATNPDSAGGICEILAAKWLEGHANDDHIANWIMNGDQMDPSKIRQLMQLFIIGSTMNRRAIEGYAVAGGKRDQDDATRRWLLRKGIIRRHGIVPMRFKGGEIQSVALGTVRNNTSRAGGSRLSHATNAANAISSDLHNGNGHYAMIGISGSGGDGHAMAAWIANDVTFFDPNYGEFYFPGKADFLRWFPEFFQKSMYSLPIFGMCEQYETRFYAKRV